MQESIAKFHPEFSKLFEAFAVTCPIKRSEIVAEWGSVSDGFSYELFDGVVENLQALREHGFRLHLWTGRDESSARKILRTHRLENFFTTMSFATDVNSKPHANSLCFDWRRSGRNQVLVLGDSPQDMIGARNIAAIRGAALWDTDTHCKRSSLIEAGAELLFYEPADFSRWLIWSRRRMLKVDVSL